MSTTSTKTISEELSAKKKQIARLDALELQFPELKNVKNRDGVQRFLADKEHRDILYRIITEGLDAREFSGTNIPRVNQGEETSETEKKDHDQYDAHAPHAETHEPEKPAEITSQEAAPDKPEASTQSPEIQEPQTAPQPSSLPQQAAPSQPASPPSSEVPILPPVPEKTAFEKVQEQQRKREAMQAVAQKTAPGKNTIRLKTPLKTSPAVAYMEQDPRFKQLVKERWQSIKHTTTLDLNGIYIRDANGQDTFNPAVPSETLRLARIAFKNRYPTAAKTYEAKEKTRAYPAETYRQHDPAVVAMDAETARVVKEEHRRLFAENPTVVTTSPQADALRLQAEKAKEPIVERFVQQYPEKAKAYAVHDQEIAQAVERVAAKKPEIPVQQSGKPAPQTFPVPQPEISPITQSPQPSKPVVPSQSIVNDKLSMVNPDSIGINKPPGNHSPFTAPVPIVSPPAQTQTGMPQSHVHHVSNVPNPSNVSKAHELPHLAPHPLLRTKKPVPPAASPSFQPSINTQTAAPRLRRRFIPQFSFRGRTRNEQQIAAPGFIPPPVPPPPSSMVSNAIANSFGRNRRRQRTPVNAFAPVESVTGFFTNLANPFNSWKKYAIAAGVAFLLFFLLVIFAGDFFGIGDETNNTQASNASGSSAIPGLDLSRAKSGPATVENDKDIPYQINFAYTGNLDITISDDIPTDTYFISAGPDGKFTCDNGACNANSKAVNWKLKDIGASPYVLSLTIHPSRPNIAVSNKVRASALASSSVSSPGNVTPNSSNCNGKYSFLTSLGNYGDPLCNFTKDDLYTMLKQQDPTNANYWFTVIVPCESGYDPNNFLGSSPDPAGAWGLFQMGRGRNGQYDHGDVVWQLQASNAINYNHNIGNSFKYWQCAR